MPFLLGSVPCPELPICLPLAHARSVQDICALRRQQARPPMVHPLLADTRSYSHAAVVGQPVGTWAEVQGGGRTDAAPAAAAIGDHVFVFAKGPGADAGIFNNAAAVGQPFGTWAEVQGGFPHQPPGRCLLCRRLPARVRHGTGRQHPLQRGAPRPTVRRLERGPWTWRYRCRAGGGGGGQQPVPVREGADGPGVLRLGTTRLTGCTSSVLPVIP